MNEAYFLGRMSASLEMARNAAGSAARLVHFELAGRYSLAAATYVAEHPRSRRAASRARETSFHSNDNHPFGVDPLLCRGACGA